MKKNSVLCLTSPTQSQKWQKRSRAKIFSYHLGVMQKCYVSTKRFQKINFGAMCG